MITSLSKSLVPRLSRKVDILIFNPPYVPTYDEEASLAQSGAEIAGAWAGGKDGMQVTNILLQQIDVSPASLGVRRSADAEVFERICFLQQVDST